MSGESLFKFTIELIETTLIGLGIVGNLICIIIFSRKTFRSNSISTYCIALAIFDCMNLSEFATDIHGLIHKTYLHDQSTALCKFIFSFFIFLTSIHPWIMVAFSLDKLLSMRVNSIAILKKKRFQWSIVAGIVLFSVGLYIYIPILVDRSEINPGYFICYPKTIGFFNAHMILIILESNLIPFVIMIITSILTIRKLIKSRNSVGQLTRDRKSRDRKYAISSITFNIIFIVLKLPVTIFFILSSFFSYFNMYMFKIVLLLFFLNSSLSFVIHMVTNSLFKREFFLLLRFGQSRETSTNIAVQNRPIRLNRISTS